MWHKQVYNYILRIHQWHQKNRDKSDKQHGSISISIRPKKKKRVIKLSVKERLLWMLLSHTRQYLTGQLILLYFSTKKRRFGKAPLCIYVYMYISYITWYLVERCVHILLPVGDQKLRWGIMAFLWYHNGYYSPQ